MKIITAQAHQAAGQVGTLTLTNDVDPRTLDLSGVTRIDLQFPAFTMAGPTARLFCCAAACALPANCAPPAMC